MNIKPFLQLLFIFCLFGAFSVLAPSSSLLASSGSLLVSSAVADTTEKKLDKPLSEFELGRYQYCGRDSDCMVALNGCCACAGGAKYVAINKERFPEFSKRFNCLHLDCASLDPNPTCEKGVVTCRFHKCKLVKESEFDKP